jgi:hypothetical protein
VSALVDALRAWAMLVPIEHGRFAGHIVGQLGLSEEGLDYLRHYASKRGDLGPPVTVFRDDIAIAAAALIVLEWIDEDDDLLEVTLERELRLRAIATAHTLGEAA